MANDDPRGRAISYPPRAKAARMGFGIRPAVVIVDMSRAFCDPSHPVGSDMSDTLKHISALLEAAREKHALIVYATIAYANGFKDLNFWGVKSPNLRSLRSGDADVEIDPRICPTSGDPLIVKKAPSAFFMTNLASLLTNAQVDTLIVTGCTTSCCVRATVVDSLSYGFRTIVPEECVADKWPDLHAIALTDMDARYADVMAVESVIDYLRSLAPLSSPQ